MQAFAEIMEVFNHDTGTTTMCMGRSGEARQAMSYIFP
jgi:hypothetical protein